LRLEPDAIVMAPRSLRKFLRASRAERKVFGLALVTVVGVRVALFLFPSGVIVRWVRRLALRPSKVTSIHATPALLMWSVQTASRYVPRASCLTQAVAGLLLLHRYGHKATLCLGVANTKSGGFRAHAWLERRGAVILGGDVSGFTRMSAFPVSKTGSSDV